MHDSMMVAEVGGMLNVSAAGSRRRWHRRSRKHADDDAEHNPDQHQQHVERVGTTENPWNSALISAKGNSSSGRTAGAR
jgi:hypothetical protein